MPPYVGIALFFSLLLLIIILFVSSLSNTYSTYYKLISGAAIFLFTCFILYDTSNILERKYNNNYVGASFDYFLDVLNLFINLIRYSQ
jgi:modulator of FtsH protease